jgi:hypothetical protein
MGWISSSFFAGRGGGARVRFVVGHDGMLCFGWTEWLMRIESVPFPCGHPSPSVNDSVQRGTGQRMKVGIGRCVDQKWKDWFWSHTVFQIRNPIHHLRSEIGATMILDWWGERGGNTEGTTKQRFWRDSIFSCNRRLRESFSVCVEIVSLRDG